MKSQESKSPERQVSQSAKPSDGKTYGEFTIEELANEAGRIKDLFAALHFLLLQDARGIKGLERVRHMINQLKRPIIDHNVKCRMVLLIERDRLEAEAIEEKRWETTH